MLLAASYPFLEVVWTMVLFFLLVAWFCLLVFVLSDIFERHDDSGLPKVLWIIFVLVLPYLGVFVYLLAEHGGMAERAHARRQAGESRAGGRTQPAGPHADPAAQIDRAKKLLEEGSITQAEFDLLKGSALSAA